MWNLEDFGRSERRIIYLKFTMGCCPFMKSGPRSPSEYQIMQDGEKAPKPSNNNSVDEDCQQIDVENDDFFEKKEQDQLTAKNPTRRLLSIKDFNAVKVSHS